MKSNRRLIQSMVLTLACTAAATAFARGQSDLPDEPIRPSKLFQRLDTNHDGYVSREEAASVRGLEQTFAPSDTNRDGKLSPGEFIKAESILQREHVAEVAEDSVITAKVKAALIRDLELKALDVGVETYHGRVLLSGFVDDRKQAQRAVRLAAAVDGVTRVENALKLK